MVPQAFDCLTISACEIVDLFQATLVSRATELICVVNELRAAMDEVLQRYDVFKVCSKNGVLNSS